MYHMVWQTPILPYIIRYNEQNETAKEVYAKFAKRIGAENLHEAVEALNEKLNIPKCFKEIIPDEEKYMEKLDEMAPLAKADGCTKQIRLFRKLTNLKNYLSRCTEENKNGDYLLFIKWISYN